MVFFFGRGNPCRDLPHDRRSRRARSAIQAASASAASAITHSRACAAARPRPASPRVSATNRTPRDFTSAAYRGMLDGSIEERAVPQCPSCAEAVESRHRYCPWCAAPLRRKLVEFFAPHQGIAGDAQALRVSRYLDGDPARRHTRLSIWDGDRAVSAISLDEAETSRLSRFLGDVRTAAPAVGDDAPTMRLDRTG